MGGGGEDGEDEERRMVTRRSSEVTKSMEQRWGGVRRGEDGDQEVALTTQQANDVLQQRVVDAASGWA